MTESKFLRMDSLQELVKVRAGRGGEGGVGREEDCWGWEMGGLGIVVSIGNKKFGIPRKYQYQIGIWYFCPKFLGIFLVFYRYFETALVKIWLNIGIFGRIKNRFATWFL